MKQKEEKLTIDFETPKFIKSDEETKLTGSQKGTLLHLCIQKLDISKQYDLNEIKKLIKDLTNKEIITELEAKNINCNAILNFINSDIWKEMKKAKEIYRERPFYITLPAKEIYNEDVEDTVLVQGIIDLYYINEKDEIILVDYKTDFVQTEEELIYKYKIQLELYKKALEDALGKMVNRVYIYSTCLKKQIEI